MLSARRLLLRWVCVIMCIKHTGRLPILGRLIPSKYMGGGNEWVVCDGMVCVSLMSDHLWLRRLTAPIVDLSLLPAELSVMKMQYYLWAF